MGNSEFLEKAKSENKPIFLSVGYSSCHWCHVMAHESFENEDIARVLNDNFINIKVDRKSDQILMTYIKKPARWLQDKAVGH